jgi:hypothetical protein
VESRRVAPSAILKVNTLTRPKLRLAPTKTASPFGKCVCRFASIRCKILVPMRYLSGYMFLAHLLKPDEIVCFSNPVDYDVRGYYEPIGEPPAALFKPRLFLARNLFLITLNKLKPIYASNRSIPIPTASISSIGIANDTG